ncbi:MAG: CPBP family intramembrane glutamic endopeptidase [Chloroherpetonaceae bacterium]|nr:CPBP family intramembrane metalloprotease [Chthonomonadaceae bacterium]MDW8207244.1 CPBP family intramembrane glutamic endopeptidase [Chloroherpetonaceae bacterium]
MRIEGVQQIPAARLLWYVGVLLLLLLLARQSLSVDPQARAAAERLEKVHAALRATKVAYLFGPGGFSGAEARDIPDREAIAQWKALVASRWAHVQDWRRLGITQMVFGQRNAGLETLRAIAGLPSGMRSGASWSGEPHSEAADQISASQEVQFWERVYAEGKLTPSEVSSLLATLNRMELRWFARLVRQQIYTKAGMQEEARQEQRAALASAQAVLFWNLVQILLLLGGIVGVSLWSVRALQRRAQDQAGVRALPVPAAPFSYRARMSAFLAYFALPLIALPLGVVVREGNMNGPTLTRLSVALYLMLTALSVLVSLQVLRAVVQKEEQKRLAFYEALRALGLRTAHFWQDVATGVTRYAMLLPLLLLTAWLSSIVFARFKTPPHPVLYQFLAAPSLADQVLLLFQTAVVAAVVEELMFRGVLFPALWARWGVWRGAAIASAVFALAHPTLPAGFLSLWTLGMGFTFVFLRSGSLVPGIVMHGLNNGLLLCIHFAVFAE